MNSTEIQTFDNVSVQVPNSNQLTNEVLNWPHKNTLGRTILMDGWPMTAI
ncbi:MAG: mechanosensitive ion channel domain-containing protein [Pseudomonadota bacterium]